MFWTKLGYGVAAGAAGVTTLNTITYLDMGGARAPVQRRSLSGGGAAGPEGARRNPRPRRRPQRGRHPPLLPADINQLHEICALTADGLNLAGIRRVLQLQEETGSCRPSWPG